MMATDKFDRKPEGRTEEEERIKLVPPEIPYPRKAFLKQMADAAFTPPDEPRLIPDTRVRFEKKAALYRKNTAVVFLLRFGAAAVLLLFLGLGSIRFYLQRHTAMPLPAPAGIEKEQPLFPRKELSAALRSDTPRLPGKLSLQRALPIRKEGSVMCEKTVEVLAVAIHATPVLPERIPSATISGASEVALTGNAQTWKSSEKHPSSEDIITSFFQVGEKLADKIRGKEYASR